MGLAVFAFVLLGLFQLSYCDIAGSNALFYLQQYGYLDIKPKNFANSSALMDARSIKRAIEDFQSFAGLDVTGELDDETAKVMSLPRCGVKDKVGNSVGRSKRYVLQGSRWKVKDLKYRINKYPKRLAREDVRKEIHRAFEVWSKYTDLTFTPVSSGPVHIEISFEYGEHGDGDPFDGPGGTLAHAYFPVFGGDAHFDASEKWSIGSYQGTNLFQVAAHEFGHSLGLSHSDVNEALMAPFYRGYDPLFELHEDDVNGIQRLYGQKTRRTNTHNDDDFDESKNVPRITPHSPPGRADQTLCKNPKIDTIFNGQDGTTYVFQGARYWALTDESVQSGYPKLISEGWPGLPSNIDAAFTFKNGKTFFFKGSKYWRYRGRKMDGDYPKEISVGFTGIPDDVDAAMVWSGNGKIYFFKGAKFWRFDPTQRPPVKRTYPKPISNWQGLPNNLDAAFQWTNGYTYFYKDNAYYRFNDREFAVDYADPAFPRSTAYWWFGCKEAPKGTIGTSESRGWLVDGESDHSNNTNTYDSLDTGDIHDMIETPIPSSQQDEDDGSQDNGSDHATVPFSGLILTILVSVMGRLLTSGL